MLFSVCYKQVFRNARQDCHSSFAWFFILQVWCLSSGKLLDTFHGSGFSVSWLAVLGETVVSASTDSSQLKVWQLNSDPKHRPKASVPANCSLVTLSKDGQTAFFVKHGSRKEVFAWDCTTGEITSMTTAALHLWTTDLCYRITVYSMVLGSVQSPQEVLCISMIHVGLKTWEYCGKVRSFFETYCMCR